MADPEEVVLYQNTTITGGVLNRAMIRGCKLQKVTARFCEIIDSTLEDCDINQSVLGDIGTPMRGYEGIEYNCHIRRCTLEASITAKVKICHSTLLNMYAVKECNMETTDLSLSTGRRTRLNNSYLQQCILDETHIDNETTLLECELAQSCSMESDGLLKLGPFEGKTSKNVNPPLSIDRFPPEIKCIILSFCVQFPGSKETNGVPAIIPALRAHDILYDESLKLFYRHGCFSMKYENEECRELLSAQTFGRIHHLSISDLYFKTDKIPAKMAGIMRIKSLNLDLKDIRADGFRLNKFYDVARDWLKAFGEVQELSLSLYSHESPDILIRKAAISAATSEASAAFGVAPTVESEGYKGYWTVGYHYSKTCVRWAGKPKTEILCGGRSHRINLTLY